MRMYAFGMSCARVCAMLNNACADVRAHPYTRTRAHPRTHARAYVRARTGVEGLVAALAGDKIVGVVRGMPCLGYA